MITKVKFIMTYVGGIATGIILMFVFLFFVGMSQNGQANSINRNVVMFEKPQQVITASTLKVIQVLPDGSALATVDIMEDNGGLVVMFLAKDGMAYYDDQKIDVPSDKCIRQVGTYTYESKIGMKTVPVVEILDK